jgi:hypothetical protein
MPRWIAFDQQTSSLLRANLAQGNRIETFGRGALDYALAKPGAVVTLLPAGENEIGIAVFRRPRPARTEIAVQRSVQPAMATIEPSSRSTRAGGFLGLSDEPAFDEPAFEDEPVEEKKGWWRRFWDE